MSSVDVESILMRVRNGETEAYGELVSLYQRDVWKVAACMLRDMAATENLVQQAFVNAYFHLDQFEPGADFGVWLKAIARNLVREELRKRSRDDAHLRQYHAQLEARLSSGEAADEFEQSREALRRCREKLPERAVRLLELRYEHGKSFEELGRQLGRTIEATRQLLSRIRIELRACVERRLSQS